MEKRSVHIGDVPCFPWAAPSKDQALKPLEEAAEVFAAWQDFSLASRIYERCLDDYNGYNAADVDELILPLVASSKDGLVDECCDVIQAVCNLLAAMGVDDLTREMRKCRSRNDARGRFDEGRCE